MTTQPELTNPRQRKLDRIVADATSILKQMLDTEPARERRLVDDLVGMIKSGLDLPYNERRKIGALELEFQALVQDVFDGARKKASEEFEVKLEKVDAEWREKSRVPGTIIWLAGQLIALDPKSDEAAAVIEKIRLAINSPADESLKTEVV